jgi:dihydroneopterin aldolase
VLIELHGLEIYGRHGVLEHEARDGQPFWFDVTLDVGDAGLTDQIEDAVDYRAVVQKVREVSDTTRFELLEALAGAVADALLTEFPVARATVRVRKQPADLPVEFTAATAERLR